MTYKAYLCYQHPYDDDEEDPEPVLKFEEPSRYMYGIIIPITFSVLHDWADKDKGLYK